MATIRASCETCGDVEFPTSDVTLHLPEDGGVGSYAFLCPSCNQTVVRSAERPVIDLLIAAGVTYTTWRAGARDRVAAEHRSMPITEDELNRFQELLSSDQAVAEALSQIVDP